MTSGVVRLFLNHSKMFESRKLMDNKPLIKPLFLGGGYFRGGGVG